MTNTDLILLQKYLWADVCPGQEHGPHGYMPLQEAWEMFLAPNLCKSGDKAIRIRAEAVNRIGHSLPPPHNVTAGFCARDLTSLTNPFS